MDTNKYNALVARAGAAGTGRLGKYESQLSAEDRRVLDEFVAWMKRTGQVPSENSRRSYRTYVAKCLAEPDGKWTSDQRSGMRKFGKFLEGKK